MSDAIPTGQESFESNIDEDVRGAKFWWGEDDHDKAIYHLATAYRGCADMLVVSGQIESMGWDVRRMRRLKRWLWSLLCECEEAQSE